MWSVLRRFWGGCCVCGGVCCCNVCGCCVGCRFRSISSKNWCSRAKSLLWIASFKLRAILPHSLPKYESEPVLCCCACGWWCTFRDCLLAVCVGCCSTVCEYTLLSNKIKGAWYLACYVLCAQATARACERSPGCKHTCGTCAGGGMQHWDVWSCWYRATALTAQRSSTLHTNNLRGIWICLLWCTGGPQVALARIKNFAVIVWALMFH
jgi:hypothetical protein